MGVGHNEGDYLLWAGSRLRVLATITNKGGLRRTFVTFTSHLKDIFKLDTKFFEFTYKNKINENI